MNHEEAPTHQLSSKTHRLGLGDLDESDVGVGDTLANKVVDAVAASTAVAGECGGSDICDAIRLLARSFYFQLPSRQYESSESTYSSLTSCLNNKPLRSLWNAKLMKLFSPHE
jgi:hypothetical protein